MEVLMALIPIISIISFVAMFASVRSPGKKLNEKFNSLGCMTGKSYGEIVSVVGPENAISTSVNANGEPIKIRQWIATGYHIVLIFDKDDMFVCISSETAV